MRLLVSWWTVLLFACSLWLRWTNGQRFFSGPPTRKFSDNQLSKVNRSFRDWRDESRNPRAHITSDQRAFLFGGIPGIVPGPGGRAGQGGPRVPGTPQFDRGLNFGATSQGATQNQGSESSTSSGRSIRKEYRQMSDEERGRFHDVLNRMKRTFPDPQNPSSQYDIFVEIHRHANAPGAHEGPGFLVWHREYLNRFEQAMRQHDARVSMPYWDSTLDQDLPDPRHSSLWSGDLMGNSEGVVITGPFAGWTAIDSCHELGQFLRRNSTRNPATARTFLYSEEDLAYIRSRQTYSDLVAPFDPKFEFDHAGAHLFVEGHMASITCSPNDPIFWLHHTFVDFLWEDFRVNHQTTNVESDYPGGDNDEFPAVHQPSAPMTPFEPLQNIDGLSRNYTTQFYTYAARPLSCNQHSDCGGKYLWCDQSRRRCRATVQLGGNCTGLPSSACYGPAQCLGSICTAVTTTIRTTTQRPMTTARRITRGPPGIPSSGRTRPPQGSDRDVPFQYPIYPGQYPFYRFYVEPKTHIVSSKPIATTVMPYPVYPSSTMPPATVGPTVMYPGGKMKPKMVYSTTIGPGKSYMETTRPTMIRPRKHKPYPTTEGPTSSTYAQTTRVPYHWKTEGTTTTTTTAKPIRSYPQTTRVYWRSTTTSTTTAKPTYKPKPRTWPTTTTTTSTTTSTPRYVPKRKTHTWRRSTTTTTPITTSSPKVYTWPPTTTTTSKPTPRKVYTRHPSTTTTTTRKPNPPRKPPTWHHRTTTASTTPRPTAPRKVHTWRQSTTTTAPTTTRPSKIYPLHPTTTQSNTHASPDNSRWEWGYRFYPRYYPGGSRVPVWPPPGGFPSRSLHPKYPPSETTTTTTTTTPRPTTSKSKPPHIQGRGPMGRGPSSGRGPWRDLGSRFGHRSPPSWIIDWFRKSKATFSSDSKKKE